MDSQSQIHKLDKEESNMPVYTLKIASQLSEIPAHSIRQYIDEGLLIPYKLESKRHLFSRQDIGRLKMIRGLIRDKGLNFAGIRSIMAMIPCWNMRDCTEEDRESCGAYSENFQPCWEAAEKGRKCKNENCRECEVYLCLDQDTGVRSVLKALL